MSINLIDLQKRFGDEPDKFNFILDEIYEAVSDKVISANDMESFLAFVRKIKQYAVTHPGHNYPVQKFRTLMTWLGAAPLPKLPMKEVLSVKNNSGPLPDVSTSSNKADPVESVLPESSSCSRTKMTSKKSSGSGRKSRSRTRRSKSVPIRGTKSGKVQKQKRKVTEKQLRALSKARKAKQSKNGEFTSLAKLLRSKKNNLPAGIKCYSMEGHKTRCPKRDRNTAGHAYDFKMLTVHPTKGGKGLFKSGKRKMLDGSSSYTYGFIKYYCKRIKSMTGSTGLKEFISMMRQKGKQEVWDVLNSPYNSYPHKTATKAEAMAAIRHVMENDQIVYYTK